MIAQHPSTIYKSNFRGKKISEKHSYYATFNFESYQNENRKSFGNLIVFNEEVLAANQSVDYKIDEDVTLIIMPLIGAVDFKISNLEGFVHVNQIQLIEAKKGSSIQISNPYESNVVNYLQIRLKTNSKTSSIDFDYENKNLLKNIVETKSFSVSTGLFQSRTKGDFFTKHNDNQIFVFTINGVFEFQDRLLEERDGLAIWNAKEYYFEALSENGILLIIELKNKN